VHKCITTRIGSSPPDLSLLPGQACWWKTIWRLLKKLNIDLPYDPAIPLLGIHPKECDSGYSRGTCTPMFIAVIFTIAKIWKQPRCLTTDEWIKKMWNLYTMQFYAASYILKPYLK
jgi:hypothetical protein